MQVKNTYIIRQHIGDNIYVTTSLFETIDGKYFVTSPQGMISLPSEDALKMIQETREAEK